MGSGFNIKIFSICLILILAFTQDNFQQFKEDMQNKVTQLANQMANIYNNRCSNAILTCQTKSFKTCQAVDQKQCYEGFPQPDGCLSEGAALSKTSSVSFPGSQNELTPQEELFICASAQLEKKFVQISQTRNQDFTFEYVGTNLGSLRVFPGVQNDQVCGDYDPRFRPWYVAATSGSKNVILIIDKSGSMANDFKLQTAKKAATSVINTLSNNDFVGVVAFSSEAEYIHETRILRATNLQKQAIIQQIDTLQAFGQTNYKQAFEKGLQMIKDAQRDQFGSPCSNSQNIILFLTDGQPTTPQDFMTSQTIIDTINQAKGSLNINLFTYGFGSEDIDNGLLRQLSCSFDGISFQVNNTSDQSQLITIMRNYYTYIAQSQKIETPIWTQPYQDAFGFGRIVSVSKAIYYFDEDGESNEDQQVSQTILGVASFDVQMDKFQSSFGLEQDEVLKKLIGSFPCQQTELSACYLQSLRDDQSKCSDLTCNNTRTELNCLTTSVSQIFTQGSNSDSNYCCGLTIGGLIGIIVGIIIVIAIIVSVTIFLCLKNRNKPKYEQQNRQNRIQSGQNIYKQDQGFPIETPSANNQNFGTNMKNQQIIFDQPKYQSPYPQQPSYSQNPYLQPSNNYSAPDKYIK